jgi:hypothetical protein
MATCRGKLHCGFGRFFQASLDSQTQNSCASKSNAVMKNITAAQNRRLRRAADGSIRMMLNRMLSREALELQG